MANKDSATRLGMLLLSALPELDNAIVVGSAPLGKDGLIVTLSAGSDDETTHTQMTYVAFDDEPDTLYELNDIPRNDDGEAPYHQLSEVAPSARMCFRWPAAIMAARHEVYPALQCFQMLSEWNGNILEFLNGETNGIRVIRVGTFDANTMDSWECIAVDTINAPERTVRSISTTIHEAIMETMSRIVRNRRQDAAVQQKLAGMDNLTPSA